MVDKINQMIRESQPSRPSNNTSKNERAVKGGEKAGNTDLNSVNSTDVKKVGLKISEQVAGMAKEAPLDMEKVSKIKNAIAEGSYPIDLKRISESLMQAYSEFK